MDIGTLFGALYTLTLIFSIVLLFLENRDPSKTIVWIMAMIFLPGVGFLLYLLFGKNQSYKNKARTKKFFDNFVNTYLKDAVDKYIVLADTQNDVLSNQPIFQDDDRRLMKLILNLEKSPVTIKNKVDIFTEGEAKFKSLLKDISEAKSHIHMEYFIVKDSYIGNKIKEALIERAKNGVKVRLLYDYVGSWRLYAGGSYVRELKKAGCEVHTSLFKKVPYNSFNINYRDHRKIVIIDGKIGYIGGINIGDEYIHKSKFRFWRDTHLRIEGEASYSLQISFITMWHAITGKYITENDLFAKVSDINDNALIQIAESGGMLLQQTVYHAYFSSITSAKRRVNIETPYFIPDESLITAIKAALLSGVDVRIIFPSFKDHFLVYHASHSYLQEVMEYGAEVYFYTKGFIHSKVLIIDDSFASVGTTNMDIRSFSLNAEINAFLYDDKSVNRLNAMFEADLKDCVKADFEEYRNKSRTERIIESYCRLFSAVL